MKAAYDVAVVCGLKRWFVDFIDDEGKQHTIDKYMPTDPNIDSESLYWGLRISLSLAGFAPVGDIEIFATL